MQRATRRAFLAASITSGAWGQTLPSQDDAKAYWDKVYAAAEPIFSQRPTDLLVSAVKSRQPGKALDIGMGQGRNSIFLAQQGWDVTGFDPSEEGVRQAKEQALKLGVRLHALVAREADFDLGTGRWDLIVLTYVRRSRPGDAARFSLGLKPQGILVYENNNVGERNELLREFLPFRILRFEDVDTNSDWHPDRTLRVEHLVAQKAG